LRPLPGVARRRSEVPGLVLLVLSAFGMTLGARCRAD
jgi:hypothetical protein